MKIKEGDLVRIKKREEILSDFDIESLKETQEWENGTEGSIDNISLPFNTVDVYVHMLLPFEKDTVEWWRVSFVDEDGDFGLKALFGTFPKEIIKEVSSQ